MEESLQKPNSMTQMVQRPRRAAGMANGREAGTEAGVARGRPWATPRALRERGSRRPERPRLFDGEERLRSRARSWESVAAEYKRKSCSLVTPGMMLLPLSLSVCWALPQLSRDASNELQSYYTEPALSNWPRTRKTKNFAILFPIWAVEANSLGHASI